MKKILYLCIGGSSMYDSQIPEQLRQLEEHGFEVTKYFILYNYQKDLIREGKNTFLKISGKNFQLKTMLGIADLDNRIKYDEFDYIYCRSTLAGKIGLNLKRAHRMKAKIITDLRGLISDELVLQKEWYGLLKSKIYARMEKEVVQKSDIVFVVSENFKTFLIKQYRINNPNNIHTIRPFINVKSFYYSPAVRKRIRSKLHLREDTKAFIYCGGLSKWQQIPETLALFKRMNDLNKNTFLIFITKETEQMKTLLAEHKIPEKAVFLAALPNNQIVEYLNAADFGFLLRESNPTNHVAYPTKFSEYLLSGLPAIMTEDIGCIPDANPKNSIIIRLNQDAAEVLREMKSRRFDRRKISANYKKLIFNKEMYELL